MKMLKALALQSRPTRNPKTDAPLVSFVGGQWLSAEMELGARQRGESTPGSFCSECFLMNAKDCFITSSLIPMWPIFG